MKQKKTMIQEHLNLKHGIYHSFFLSISPWPPSFSSLSDGNAHFRQLKLRLTKRKFITLSNFLRCNSSKTRHGCPPAHLGRWIIWQIKACIRLGLFRTCINLGWSRLRIPTSFNQPGGSIQGVWEYQFLSLMRRWLPRHINLLRKWRGLRRYKGSNNRKCKAEDCWFRILHFHEWTDRKL